MPFNAILNHLINDDLQSHIDFVVSTFARNESSIKKYSFNIFRKADSNFCLMPDHERK